VCDYDDLLEHWLVLLKTAPEVRTYFVERFRHVLVDEYQDTNTLQAQIVDTIGAHHRVMVVGDDAQCIYSWRGANFENIMTFPDRHPGTVIHRIETNYRSTPEILNLANGVLMAQPKGRHFDKELRAARSHMEKPYIVQAIDDREQAAFLVKRIRSLHEDEGVSLNNIAVLYRSHFIAVETQIALARAGIPYHITSGVKFFERQHIRDLVALLRFVYNPADEQAWARVAVLLPKVGDKGAQKLHAAGLAHARDSQRNFIDALGDDEVRSKVPRAGLAEWDGLVASLLQVRGAMQDGKPADAVETAIDGWYGDYLKGAYADYTDRLEELNALVGFAQRFEETQDFLAQILLLNSETSDRHVDPDMDAVKLTTVHQAKGLEYDVVFVIGLADGQFPGRRSIEAGDVEEERRLFYVAVTRARNELYLCYPKIASRPGPGGMMHTPSRFLQELSPDVYQELKIKRLRGW
jgi:DNA helicase-2/ATP-dependent DNA helicase PcrA